MTIDEVYKQLESKFAEAGDLCYVRKINKLFNEGRADGLFYAMNLLESHSEYAKDKKERLAQLIAKENEKLNINNDDTELSGAAFMYKWEQECK